MPESGTATYKGSARSWGESNLRSVFVICVSAFVLPVGDANARDLFTLPIYGEFSSHGPASGEVAAGDDGIGRFWVQSKKGRRCTGEYNVRDTRLTLPIQVRCSDGAVGTATVKRAADLMSGSATIRLSDRSTGKFTFGNNASPTTRQLRAETQKPRRPAAAPNESKDDTGLIIATYPETSRSENGSTLTLRLVDSRSEKIVGGIGFACDPKVAVITMALPERYLKMSPGKLTATVSYSSTRDSGSVDVPATVERRKGRNVLSFATVFENDTNLAESGISGRSLFRDMAYSWSSGIGAFLMLQRGGAKPDLDVVVVYFGSVGDGANHVKNAWTSFANSCFMRAGS